MLLALLRLSVSMLACPIMLHAQSPVDDAVRAIYATVLTDHVEQTGTELILVRDCTARAGFFEAGAAEEMTGVSGARHAGRGRGAREARGELRKSLRQLYPDPPRAGGRPVANHRPECFRHVVTLSARIASTMAAMSVSTTASGGRCRVSPASST